MTKTRIIKKKVPSGFVLYIEVPYGWSHRQLTSNFDTKKQAVRYMNKIKKRGYKAILTRTEYQGPRDKKRKRLHYSVWDNAPM